MARRRAIFTSVRKRPAFCRYPSARDHDPAAPKSRTRWLRGAPDPQAACGQRAPATVRGDRPRRVPGRAIAGTIVRVPGAASDRPDHRRAAPGPAEAGGAHGPDHRGGPGPPVLAAHPRVDRAAGGWSTVSAAVLGNPVQGRGCPRNCDQGADLHCHWTLRSGKAEAGIDLGARRPAAVYSAPIPRRMEGR